jgi:hypothetical protein
MGRATKGEENRDARSKERIMFPAYQHQERRIVHGVIAVFVLATCLRVWVGPTAFVEPARAQIPDAGTQRKVLVEEARRTNELLTEIKELLEVGTFNVRTVGADNQAHTPVTPPGGRKPARP